MKNRHVLVAVGILLVAVSFVIAQPLARAEPLASYQSEIYLAAGGGTSQSASFQTVSVMGLPSTGSAQSASYRTTGGFLPAQGFDLRLWLPSVRK